MRLATPKYSLLATIYMLASYDNGGFAFKKVGFAFTEVGT